ncbi:MAG: phage virion morphogenesis protein [Magnetococcales bacterium]|nr:phage virion morphogenesis protein [Magnetococcales bacterium]
MAGITLTFDQAHVDAIFSTLIHTADDLTPAMRAIGEHLITTTQTERFDAQKDPQGNTWTPLAESTKKHKKHSTILDESSRLRNSIHYDAGPNEVRVGTDVIYAAIHQLGGQAGRGYRATIPARPYLGISDDDQVRITEILQDYLAQAVK